MPRELADMLIETADDMRRVGVIDEATHRKITQRHVRTAPSLADMPISPTEIRELRDRANLSQAVFARLLNLTPGYVSQLERGVKRPTGPALALLNVIRRKGMEAIL